MERSGWRVRIPNFRKGTEIVANAITTAKRSPSLAAASTLAAIDLFGIADKISYISTGGGAFLNPWKVKYCLQ
ncbi:phosphoglycerate kinase [Escherichia coli]